MRDGYFQLWLDFRKLVRRHRAIMALHGYLAQANPVTPDDPLPVGDDRVPGAVRYLLLEAIAWLETRDNVLDVAAAPLL